VILSYEQSLSAKCDAKTAVHQRTSELLWVLLHVRENERIGVCDEKSMSEDVDDGSDAEVRRSVELRPLRRTSRLCDACLLEELATDHSRVLDRRLVDRDHVVRQTIGDDKSTTFVQWIWSVLQHK